MVTALRSALTVLTIGLSGTAWANTVVVFDPLGSGGTSAVSITRKTLTNELKDHQITKKSKPKGIKKLTAKSAPALAKAVRAVKADVGVACQVEKKHLFSILAVSSDGAILFDKTVKLPRSKSDAKIAALARSLGRALSDHLTKSSTTSNTALAEAQTDLGKATQNPVVSSDSKPIAQDFENRPTDPTNSETPKEDAEATQAAGSQNQGEPLPFATGLAADSSSPNDSPQYNPRQKQFFHLAAHAGIGMLTLRDKITTPVKGGDLTIGVPLAIPVEMGLEFTFGKWASFLASFRRYSAQMSPGEELRDNPSTPTIEDAIEPADIGTADLGMTLLAGPNLELGPIIGGALVGFAYDQFSADPQILVSGTGVRETAVVVPAWKRSVLLLGIAAGYGDLSTEGITFQLGALMIPWGSHSETPLTSGQSASVLGAQAWLKGRYQLPNLFKERGGIFLDLTTNLELLRIQFEGEGTRKALRGTELVQASKELRFILSGILSVGYVY